METKDVIVNEVFLVFFLVSQGYVKDISTARRLIFQGAIRVDGRINDSLSNIIDTTKIHEIHIGYRARFVYVPEALRGNDQ